MDDTDPNRDIASEGPIAQPWHLAARVIFRFAFVYAILFISWTSLDLFLDSPQYVWLIAPPVITFARLFLGLRLEIPPPSGSGDTTFNYITVLFILATAAVVTAAWSILDRRRNNYAALLQWLMLYVRLALACTLVVYGTAKVVPTQFISPRLGTLLESYGDSSPMRLLWTFMGASKAYTIFSGGAEVLAGVLLFVPRFTTLGALLSAAVFTNVFMLNMSYDVPVKIFSFHCLAMSILLLHTDIKALSDLLIFRRTATPAPEAPLFKSARLNFAMLALQIVFGAFVTAASLWENYDILHKYGDLAPKAAFYGIWTVDEFRMNGRVMPPLLTDRTRWRQLVFDRPEVVMAKLMDGELQRFKLTLDPARKTLSLQDFKDPKKSSSFLVEQLPNGQMLLTGTLEGQKLQVRLSRIDESRFLLTSRGFHWINEFPFNR